MKKIELLETEMSPRDVLAFPLAGKEDGLPIQGGWGYTQATACIIDANDPVVDPDEPFYGVGIEYEFVEQRILQELFYERPEGERFFKVRWKLQEQKLIFANDRAFDHLVFDIKALWELDWNELKAEFEGPMGNNHPQFDLEAHTCKREERMVRITRDFWFDITSFYGDTSLISVESVMAKILGSN